MKTLSNKWNIPDVEYAKKLAVLNARIKDTIDACKLPQDSRIEIEITAGEKNADDYVHFILIAIGENYNSCTTDHSFSHGIVRYTEEYFDCPNPNTCTTKVRNGEVKVKFIVNGQARFLDVRDIIEMEKTGKDHSQIKSINEAARAKYIYDTITKIAQVTCMAAQSIIDTSHFKFDKNPNVAECEKQPAEKPDDEE